MDILGTNSYHSPEILRKKSYDGKKSDVFSLGKLLFVIVIGSYGFESFSANDHLYRYIIKKDYETYWNKFPNKNIISSNEFKNLYTKMVAFTPEERPTIDEILECEWMKELKNLNEKKILELENELRKYLIGTKTKKDQD